MPPYRMDVVTVFHSEKAYRDHLELTSLIARYEAKGGWQMIGVDNRVTNRGFAAGCNLGAFDERANAPVIGFINPDAIVTAAFMDDVMAAMRDGAVIAGPNFGKTPEEIRSWGLRTWVCGAAFFVNREWFTEVGGFDEQFVWAWEETDLCRRAEQQRRKITNLRLPIEHDSPDENTPEEAAYKNEHFDRGAILYRRKWTGR